MKRNCSPRSRSRALKSRKFSHFHFHL